LNGEQSHQHLQQPQWEAFPQSAQAIFQLTWGQKNHNLSIMIYITLLACHLTYYNCTLYTIYLKLNAYLYTLYFYVEHCYSTYILGKIDSYITEDILFTVNQIYYPCRNIKNKK
jgi:hypothetical protein